MNEKLVALPISDKDEVEEKQWEKLLKKYWSPVLSILISIFAGFVVGLSTRSLHESYVYGSIFGIESFVCAVLALILKESPAKTTFWHFTLYFAITGAMTVFSSWFGFMLS